MYMVRMAGYDAGRAEEGEAQPLQLFRHSTLALHYL